MPAGTQRSISEKPGLKSSTLPAGCRAGGKHRAAHLLALPRCLLKRCLQLLRPPSAPPRRSRGRLGPGGTGASARTFQVALVEASSGGGAV